LSARAWGRLLRLSLAPTAIADVAAGLAIGASGDWPSAREVSLLIGSSLGVYHGAMALNDWADRERDRSTRPDRPIPSGAISPRAGALTGVALVALGVASAAFAAHRAGAWMAVVATLALLYDVRGRGPWLGPLLLGLCRAGNLGLGLFYTGLLAATASEAIDLPLAFSHAPMGERVPRLGWLVCALYGTYVFFASRLGRLEDDEDAGVLGRRPTSYLASVAAVLIALPFVDPYGSGGFRWNVPAGACAWLGALGLLRAAFGTRVWSRALVGRAMGLALRRLLVFTATCALLSAPPFDEGGGVLALAILAGYPLSFVLREVFPPS